METWEKKLNETTTQTLSAITARVEIMEKEQAAKAAGEQAAKAAEEQAEQTAKKIAAKLVNVPGQAHRIQGRQADEEHTPTMAQRICNKMGV